MYIFRPKWAVVSVVLIFVTHTTQCLYSALCGPTTCALKINERMSKIHDSSNKVELRFTFIS